MYLKHPVHAQKNKRRKKPPPRLSSRLRKQYDAAAAAAAALCYFGAGCSSTSCCVFPLLPLRLKGAIPLQLRVQLVENGGAAESTQMEERAVPKTVRSRSKCASFLSAAGFSAVGNNGSLSLCPSYPIHPSLSLSFAKR